MLARKPDKWACIRRQASNGGQQQRLNLGDDYEIRAVKVGTHEGRPRYDIYARFKP
jgi:hypothetical protein